MAKFEEKEYNTSSFDLNLWKNIFLLMKDQFRELYKLTFYISRLFTGSLISNIF